MSPSMGAHCGIAVFADDIAKGLAAEGCHVETVSGADPVETDSADVVLLQHHEELMPDAEILRILRGTRRPVVVFKHSAGADTPAAAVTGFVAMSRGLLPATGGVPTLCFPHPATTPSHLSDRTSLRRRFSLPADARIVGTSGFLKFDRELVPLLRELLPRAERLDWVVQLLTSPWRLPSPGLLEQIAELGEHHHGRLIHVHEHLDAEELNLRLQACDLLWCWTRAPSAHYASGVVSRHYASGSRMVVAQKHQHGHVLGLPNVVAAAATLPGFVDDLTAEMTRRRTSRHDPRPVSWEPHMASLARFLRSVTAARATGPGSGPTAGKSSHQRLDDTAAAHGVLGETGLEAP
ncbi:hypothetical protein ACJ6WF_32130 [Streptomyces sp. MMS24-I2-30]|uniref:hypothetical protein n=2 Tax=unclassified Streptomyces TaxID=2593676 RepID=UPI003896ADEA